MSEGSMDGWNEHSKLVLNELKRLNARLDSLEQHIETKIDRTLMSFKADQKSLESEVVRLKIEIAVLKRDVALKSTLIAMAISIVIGVAGLIIKVLYP